MLGTTYPSFRPEFCLDCELLVVSLLRFLYENVRRIEVERFVYILAI